MSAFVLEQFLRERFPGWNVPGVVVHRGHRAFVYERDDSIYMPRHNIYVLRSEHEAWMRAGHDPGDEDRG